MDFVKIDWCGSKNGHSAEELHTNFSHWMNATGRPMWLELCRGYSHPLPDYVAKVAQSWRATGDNWDYWPHTTDTIQAFVGTSHLAGPYNWNYGDFLVSDAASWWAPSHFAVLTGLFVHAGTTLDDRWRRLRAVPRWRPLPWPD